MRLLASLLALVCLAGCGLKGPLYIPTPAQQRESAEREQRLKERKEREREEREQAQQEQDTGPVKEVAPRQVPPAQ